MAQPQLVEDVGVRGGEIGDRVLAEDQPLEHGLVDEAPRHLLVGAQRLHVRLLDGGADELLVDAVEVHHAAGAVQLLPEGQPASRSDRRSP